MLTFVEWSTQTLHPTLASVVARVSTRVFLGGEICHDQEWLGIVKQFLKNNLECAYALRRWPAFMAPVVKHFIGAYSATQKAYAESNVYIGKILKARYASMAEQGEDYIKPNDALQWAMDMGEPDEKLADFQLFLSAFAVHTTSSALTQMIFDLCQHPEFIEPLREEIRDVVGDEIFETKSQVQRLRKLDSFMKESQRMNPIQHSKPPQKYPSHPLTNLCIQQSASNV